ncbi:MAG: type II toxin-antitoxin system HicB family antitoxin [Candidatus Brocadia sp. AMX2]|uniref:type II toxin-antitoxin system HicB family antitoxin n=1 Tax=Candidatus Brocadia TaxID=380240 RepID=UPI0009E3B6BF|nr:MAG: type II toxin-antitoxin system HicB family antitoxin [Candidatus Brocadia sp. AMX2]MBC6931067.1 type II toxin-antitoxin system HicB family antitoxin [Candidatus Brocadia sp.]MBL1168156.1 type II toxin-antitoxin system HicB family antitoxin [Candidatus Brocadia sp. AMX1]NOG40928.1 type II toxin-antitoxin system HicB family antitoxin [Planctomycetota bacterium]MCE7865742.1 type II toxin-antitoxin system HicB family antitoxin [Candidatus Brocadia sp. AMX2]
MESCVFEHLAQGCPYGLHPLASLTRNLYRKFICHAVSPPFIFYYTCTPLRYAIHFNRRLFCHEDTRSQRKTTFVAKIPELPGCMAHGNTLEDALKNATETIQLWIDTVTEPRIDTNEH